jgi:hypothetical protein
MTQAYRQSGLIRELIKPSAALKKNMSSAVVAGR